LLLWTDLLLLLLLLLLFPVAFLAAACCCCLPTIGVCAAGAVLHVCHGPP
jgi:hypothetical protein